MRVLLVTWDGAGSLNPTIALIESLHAHGHTVYVLGHDSQESAVTRSGGQFRRYAKAPQLDQGKPHPVFDFNVWFDQFNQAAAADFLAEAARLKPEVVVIDSMMGPLFKAARRLKAPQVAFVHAAFSSMTQSRQAISEADLALSCSYPAFDLETTFPANMVFVGPLRPATNAPAWSRTLPHRPLVVASVSTGHQGSFQPHLLQRICDALSSLPVEGLVTTGRGISPDELTAAPNVTILRNVDHTVTLPGASLFITHCGHGSVMAGLQAGVPMLCLPPIADQPHNALMLETLGIGEILSVMAPADVIAESARRVISNFDMHSNAIDFAAANTFPPQPGKAVELIESLAPSTSAQRWSFANWFSTARG